MKKKDLYSVELSVLFPDAPMTSAFVNRLYNKPVKRGGKVVGKIVHIEPKGEDDWLILMEVEAGLDDQKKNEKTHDGPGTEQECSRQVQSCIEEN